MKIMIAAVGKIKPSPELSLFEEYRKRLGWTVEVRELDAKKYADKQAATMQLFTELGKCHKIIALDETGKNLTSQQFADRIGTWQQQGCSSLGVMIGGADGLDRAQLKRADLLLSFGQLTWPHLLTRAMLAEQLYRVYTLLNGHPYHRT